MATRRHFLAPMPLSMLHGWLVLGFGAIAGSLLLTTAGDDLGQKVAAMGLLAFMGMAAVGFDIGHPYVWFGGSFTLYSVSGPLLKYLGVHPYLYWGGWPIDSLDFSRAMDLQFLALAVTQVVIGPRRVQFDAAVGHPDTERLCKGVLPVLLFGIVLGAVNVIEILGQGFAAKGQYVLYGGWTTRLSFAFNILSTALGVYLAKQFLHARPSRALLTVGMVFIAGLLVVALVGQRHFLFRSGLVMVFVLHIFWRPLSLRVIAPFALIALLFGTILGGLKMVLVVDDEPINAGTTQIDSLYDVLSLRNPELAFDSAPVRLTKLALVSALGTEAMTAGNNLAMILSRVPNDMPFLGGSTILSDLARALLPGFIVARQLANTGEVYNDILFPETTAAGGGVGFSIVGYGYIHFGVPGVILVMTLIGGLIAIVYRWAARSAMGLFFFIGFVPVAVYVARTDITGPISQGIKHVLLPLVLMLIVASVTDRAEATIDRRIWFDRRKGAGVTRHPERDRRSASSDRRIHTPASRRALTTSADDP